jgi:hypothetical protein
MIKTVAQAIKKAEKLLPGSPANEGEPDPRWMAIIKIGDFIETEPEQVWLFIRKWGIHPNEDVRMAIACCLLEHLLEHHFEDFFPKVKKACYQSNRFAFTFRICDQFGQAEQNDNSKAFVELKNSL